MACEKMQECLLDDCDSSLISIQDLYERQLNIEQFKDFQSFQNIVKRALRNSQLINYILIDSKHLKETCLDIASKNGFTEFVKILLGQGVKLNRVNNTYNHAPIHFAAEGGHVDTLEALLADATVNPNLQAGQQTALHIAVNRNDQKCALQLLQKGASANIPNGEGLTASRLAVKKKQHRFQHDMAELIQQEQWQSSDLDSYSHNNQTIGKVIHQNRPNLELHKYPFYHKYDLQYYLMVNDETNFLKNMPKETSLSNDECLKLLKIAMRNNLRKAVREILKSLKEIEGDTRKKFFVEQAARMAIEKGHYAVLQELLNVVPEITKDLIIDVCWQLKKLRDQDKKLDISDWLECMNLMLDKEGVNIRAITDEKSNTPLHYAAKSGFSEAISLFLNRDSYIGHLNDVNKPPIADIPESMLSNYFDNCIQMKTDQQTNKCAIEFNYRCLMPPNVSKAQGDDLGTRELEVFMYIANNNNLKQLLKHPLLSSFLHLKWHMIRHLLFVNFIIYVVFYILLNGYILSMAYKSSPNKDEAESFNMSLGRVSMQMFQNVHQNNMLQNSIIIMLSLYIFRDFILLLSCFKHYTKDFTNWLQISLIALSIAMLCSNILNLLPDYLQLNIGVTVILISTWKLMILISQYPRFTTGIVIFQTVFWNFVCLFVPYIFLVIAFALVFQIFFKDGQDPNFKDSNLIFSISKIIIMLTGEFDIDDITFQLEESMWIRFVFVIFVLLMVIVLMNMINGIAVSDTAEILCKTELIGLIERIHLIAYFENIACAIDESLRRWSSRCLLWKSFASLASRTFLSQNYLRDKDGKISFEIEDSRNSHDDNNVPSEKKGNKFYASWKMDRNIIERAKQIIFNKNQQSDNEKIMIALNKLQEAMGIEVTKI
ncbi:transient receptor potential cation channel protein painless [Solenopsis invicta]|uniref:transient receptor potential cation channel protein painless n=1 Tax=Solenopsis invicta TaxID=13686 RepID=UPI00193EBD73|nr:transient receptor potential cation channel protein painless [Solenopsis invicta]XP_039303762.1 transient receptor potential cation channel protein painless [Solenopsis invicta]